MNTRTVSLKPLGHEYSYRGMELAQVQYNGTVLRIQGSRGALLSRGLCARNADIRLLIDNELDLYCRKLLDYSRRVVGIFVYYNTQVLLILVEYARSSSEVPWVDVTVKIWEKLKKIK